MATAEQLTKDVIHTRSAKAAEKWVSHHVTDIVRYAKVYIDGDTAAGGLKYKTPIPEKYYNQVDAVYTELKTHFPDSYVFVTLDIPSKWMCWRKPCIIVKISW